MEHVISKQLEDIFQHRYHPVERVVYKNVYPWEWINIYYVRVLQVVHQ